VKKNNQPITNLGGIASWIIFVVAMSLFFASWINFIVKAKKKRNKVFI